MNSAVKRQRTVRACQRCRTQKLRCNGEIPCDRCVRLRVTCRDVASNPHHANHAAEHEEILVHKNLESISSLSTTETKLHSALRRITQLEASIDSINLRLSNQGSSKVASLNDPIVPQAENSTSTHHHVHPTASSSDSQFPALFSDVAFDKKTLENRQETRANSPEIDHDVSPDSRAAAGQTNTSDTSQLDNQQIRKIGILNSPFERPLDPITESVISTERAQELFDFFFEKCHTYVPLFDTRKLPGMEEMRLSDLCLFCSIIAIAARYSEAFGDSYTSQQVEREREDIYRIVEAHIAKTLIQPRHRLSDVQAIILLHAYGLRSGGSGHDPWIISGHAFRLAKRLSIDRITTLQSISNSLSQSTSLPRRTWLLLCASDCFPSLGFGRPASPRENLESCTTIINIFAERYAKLSSASKTNELDKGEFFIASQVELAFISRRLMDWVAQTNLSSSRASDLRSIAHKYDMLVDQLDSCEVRWNGPNLGSTEQWSTSCLFRLHVRLCLATFIMRLGETAMSNGDSKKKRHPGTGTNNGDQLSNNRSQEISDRLQIDCRRACLKSAREMVEIHKRVALPYLPDYLVTALAQAIITSVGILETQQHCGHIDRIDATSQAQLFIDDAQSILSNFMNNQTGLASFLLQKVLDRARRSNLLDLQNIPPALTPPGLHLYNDPERDGRASDMLNDQRDNHSSFKGPIKDAISTGVHVGSRRHPQSNRIPDSYHSTTQQATASGQQSSNAGGETLHSTTGISAIHPTGTETSSNVVLGSSNLSIADIDMWLGGGAAVGTNGSSDPSLQWGGLSQWWNGDDPLQLLFGINSSNYPLPREFTSSDTGESMKGSVLGGNSTSPY